MKQQMDNAEIAHRGKNCENVNWLSSTALRDGIN
jgi:hypothetical protein